MLGHKQGQGLEGVFGNVDLSRVQKGVEPLSDVEHFIMGLCLFPGVKDHIFFSMRYDNIFHDNGHAVLSPVRAVIRNCVNASALTLSLGRAGLAVSPHRALLIKDNIYEHMSRCQACLE
jgi:hypothetical protein